MNAEPEINAETPGDDDFLPDRRAWFALPLTIMFWAAIFTVVFFATRGAAVHNDVAAEGYIVTLFITFVLIIFFVIPMLTLFFGRVVEDASSQRGAFVAALKFAAYGLVLGVVPAVFIYFLNNEYEWLPFTQFIIPSALAGAIARLSLDGVLRHASLRFAAIVVTTIIVVGSLLVGVAVMQGGI